MKAIISNTGNDTSSLRYLNVGIYIYNSGGGSPVFQDLDTTVLVNVDNTAGRVERGSGDYTIIRTLNATQYIEFQVGSLQATGNYDIESAVFNIEEVGASYVAGVGQFLPLTGGTVTGAITVPTLKTSALPTLTNEIGYYQVKTVASGITIPVFPTNVLLTFFDLNPGVHIVKCATTVDRQPSLANYGTTAFLNQGFGGTVITENFTVVVDGGLTTNYVNDTIVVPYGTTLRVEFRAYVGTNAVSTIQTAFATKCSAVRIAL